MLINRGTREREGYNYNNSRVCRYGRETCDRVNHFTHKSNWYEGNTDHPTIVVTHLI